MLSKVLDYFKRSRYGIADIVKRTGHGEASLLQTPVRYREFLIPKRGGGQRSISAPEKDLKDLQRLLLRKVFRGLKAHPACYGFVRGRSIAHHARVHANRPLVFRVDIKDFFPSITAERLYEFYRAIGWDRRAAGWLASVTTHNGRLPQGAPTSPALANAVNYRLDKRLTRLCERFRATYTRYADDLTFSFHREPAEPDGLLTAVYAVLEDEGYAVQTAKKTRMMRRHDRQTVTGLVVNRKVALPRETRRRLRAARHHVKTGRPATWTQEQLDGWAALEAMIRTQS